MRAFLALEVPADSKRKLVSGRGRLGVESARRFGVRWTPAENLHLTVRFLGEIEEDLAADLTRNLEDALAGFGRVEVTIDRIAWFPEKRPTVLAGMVERTEAIVDLFSAVEREAVSAGLVPETRDPSPHVTLARLKRPIRRPPEITDETVNVRFVAGALTLFRSQLQSTGAVHTPINQISLRGMGSQP